ncbi:uncharacterized protein [Watersipora subatra]|uniref:uncharacterized protein n=1 Tax=Watersipora subatra TaxID=2589382 RepID=UPI00355C3E37
MRAFRGTPHSATGETANFMMMGRELRLPDQLSVPVATDSRAIQPYVLELANQLEETYEILHERQMKVRIEDEEEPPLFEVGDLVLLVNKSRRRGENPKLQLKYLGPYTTTKCHPNNTYQVERQGQVSVQNEECLKPYVACPEADGRAPAPRSLLGAPTCEGLPEIGEEERESWWNCCPPWSSVRKNFFPNHPCSAETWTFSPPRLIGKCSREGCWSP